MPAQPQNPSSSSTESAPWPLAPVLSIIGEFHRWRMLEHIVRTGKPQMSQTLARIADLTPTACSKHLAALRRTGILVRGDGRLYDLAPSLQPPAGEYTIKFGFLTLHFPPPGQPPQS